MIHEASCGMYEMRLTPSRDLSRGADFPTTPPRKVSANLNGLGPGDYLDNGSRVSLTYPVKPVHELCPWNRDGVRQQSDAGRVEHQAKSTPKLPRGRPDATVSRWMEDARSLGRRTVDLLGAQVSAGCF